MTYILTIFLALPSLAAALVLGPSVIVPHGPCRARTSLLQRCANDCGNAEAGREVVESFVAATERGDAAAASELCTEDLFYKTHRATTDSLAAAQERLRTKVPAPSKVTKELYEESDGKFVREIVVKPIPFVTVAIRQEFDVDCPTQGTDEEECPTENECRVNRAEFIKQ